MGDLKFLTNAFPPLGSRGDPESPSFYSGSQDDNSLYLLEKCHPETLSVAKGTQDLFIPPRNANFTT